MTLVAGQTRSITPVGRDADGDDLSWSLAVTHDGTPVSGDWFAIAADGTVTFTTDAALIRPTAYQVSVTARDPFASGSATFSLTVSADTQAPQVSIALDKDPVNRHQPLTVSVGAVDDVAVASLSAAYGKFAANGTPPGTYTPLPLGKSWGQILNSE